MKFRLLVATMALALGAVSQAAPITLNFEGIAPYPNSSNVLINNFYNGGTSSNGSSGTNYGVQFTSDAVLLCLNTIGTTCSNTSKGGTGVAGSDRGAMYFLNANPTMNVAAGFDTGFAMAFSNPFAANTGIEFWTGLDATGVLITSATLGNTTNGTEGGACSAYGNVNYCPFANFSTTFAGTAHSVRFTGGVNNSVYDDFTFGSVVVGGGGGNRQVPEPDTLALLGLAMTGLVALRRRKLSV